MRETLTRELEDYRKASAEAALRAAKELEEIREASARGTRELSDRARRREEVEIQRVYQYISDTQAADPGTLSQASLVEGPAESKDSSDFYQPRPKSS